MPSGLSSARSCGASTKGTDGKIYFLESLGDIKIGFSKSVHRRLKTLATASPTPFLVIGTIDGSKQLERAIHKTLAQYRKGGEWFTGCADVRKVIDDLMANGPAVIGFVEPPLPLPVEPIEIKMRAPTRLYRFRRCVALICVRIAHIWGDLAEWIMP
jgi:hypothetical protein